MHLHSIDPNLDCCYIIPRSTVLRLFYSIISLLYQGVIASYFLFPLPVFRALLWKGYGREETFSVKQGFRVYLHLTCSR